MVTRIDNLGKPIEPPNVISRFQNTCGFIARDRVPIRYRRWTSSAAKFDEYVVPQDLKDQLWNELKEHFTFPEGSEVAAKKHALQSMGQRFKNWKTELNATFVRQGRRPDFTDAKFAKLQPFWDEFEAFKTSEDEKRRSISAKQSSRKNTIPHHLGPGGYIKAIPKWKEKERELLEKGIRPATSDMEERAVYWMFSHGADYSEDGSLSYKDSRTEEVSKRIVEIHEQVSQGSRQSKRQRDVLTEALGTPEHPGRTRGLGLVPWKLAFQDHTEEYRRRKRGRSTYTDSEIDALVASRVQEQMQIQTQVLQEVMHQKLQQAMANMDAGRAQQLQPSVPPEEQPLHSPDGLKSSCASAKQASDVDYYPVDDITVRTPCQLHVKAGNLSLVVAQGMVYPKETGAVLHGTAIPPGYAKVSVDEVGRAYRGLELDVPGGDGIKTLGDAIHTFIVWPKRYIAVDSGCDNDASSNPRASPPPSVGGPPAPAPPESALPPANDPPPSKVIKSAPTGSKQKSHSARRQPVAKRTPAKQLRSARAPKPPTSKPPAQKTVDFAYEDREYEEAPIVPVYKVGMPLLPEDKMASLPTQMLRLHEWYMERSKRPDLQQFISFQYKEEDFHSIDSTEYMDFSDLWQVYNQDAVDICFMKISCL